LKAHASCRSVVELQRADLRAVTDLTTMRVSRSSRISVNLTPEELAQVQAFADAEGRSVSNFCHQLIKAFLAHRNRPN
jgi:hypothetical protein